jgi:3-oxoacyl-[acyl-carrier protein] reductase
MMSNESETKNKPVEPLFAGKIAIVTGAAHGFGRAISVEMARRGANVVAVDVADKELEQTLAAASLAKDYGGGVKVRRVDVTREEEVQACVDWTVSEYGKIDILVNNAGGVLGQVHKPVEKVTSTEWAEIMDVNLNGVFYFIRSASIHMKERHYGRIVNVSSGAGRSFSLTGIQAYASAKAGQIGLTRQMARELGAFHITVNNVAPGFVRSNPNTERQWLDMTEQGRQGLIESISLHRLGTAEEIAYAVLFFASDYAGYISGQVISVDGGQQMF